MIFQTSPEGRARIEQFEGLRLHAYQDIAGVWTIGYGHTGPEVGPGVVWTKEQCDEALSRRLAVDFEPAVNAVCSDVPTSQGQFDAMVCLAYNIGTAGFAHSEVAKQHRLHNWDAAADAFEHWDHVNGRVNEALHNRRVKEAQVYLDASPIRFTPLTDENGTVSPSDKRNGGGVILTPMYSDPIGSNKSVAVGAVSTLAVPLTWWTRVKYGLDMPVEVALGLLGFSSTILAWLVPHGLERK